MKEAVVKGVIWSAVQGWGSQAGSLVVFFLLARLLEPDAFGLVALANIFLAFMQIFLNQGFAQAIVQRQVLDPEHLDTAFWTNFAIGILLTLISFTTANSVAIWFQQSQLAAILQGFSLLFLITSFSTVQQAILERNLNFKAIALRGLTGTVVGGCVGVAMAVYGFGAWSLVGQQLVQELVGVFVLWRSSDWRPGYKLSWFHFQHLFNFGISILGFNFLTFFNTRADDFLIGYFLGTISLGYYSLAYRILGVLTQLLVTTSKQVALPTFSKFQLDIERFRSIFYTATQLTSLVAFPTFLAVIALAPELVVVIFGEQWKPSILVLQVLCVAGILQSISFFKSSVFIALGKPMWALWLGLLATGLNLIGFTIAVQWGIVAVAAAFVLRAYLVFPIGQWAVSRLIQVPLTTYLQQFSAPLISSVVMFVGILSIKQLLGDWLNMPLLLILCIGVGTLLYGLMIRLCSPLLFQKIFGLIHLVMSRSKSQNI